MFTEWYFIILILALVWAAGWGILYLIIRLAVTHALKAQAYTIHKYIGHD